jgi:hypothetical protein
LVRTGLMPAAASFGFLRFRAPSPEDTCIGNGRCNVLAQGALWIQAWKGCFASCMLVC